MRKRLISFGLMLVIISLVAIQGTVSAEMLAGVQIGYGSTTYGDVLGQGSLKTREWLSNVWVEYDHNDLLFTGAYQGALALEGQSVGRHLAHIGANYRALEDGPLKVYGGLGYQLITSNFKVPKFEDDEKFSLTGHGFTGQAVIEIGISPEFRTSATLALAPWMNWSFGQAKTLDSRIDSSAAFNAKLDLLYDFSEEFGLHLSVSGGTYNVPEFDSKGKTRASYSAVNLGITKSF